MTDFPYKILPQLAEFRIPVYASKQVHPQAQALANRFEQAYLYLKNRLDIPLEIRLALLSEQDWPHYVHSPIYGAAVYDYPHRTIVTGAEPTTFWQPIVARLEREAPALHKRLTSVYRAPGAIIDLNPHIELWMIHDLGHACHLHDGYWFPRKWLMELFATLCLYTYIADREPHLLPVAETFLLVLHQLPAQLVEHRSLTDFEARYTALPLDNYLWFSGHFMESARELYAQFGRDALTRVWRMFVLGKIGDVSDRELQQQMMKADPAIATSLLAVPEQYS